MKKKLAIVGSGISAMGCAWYLRDEFQITIFEQNDYLGGHTHTHVLQEDGKRFTVDTGFIIFNLKTYPNLVRLFRELGVAMQSSVMTFSVWDRIRGIYYGSGGLGALFAQPGTWRSVRHWKLLLEVLRFYRQARRDSQAVAGTTETVAEYCARRGFSHDLIDSYLAPVVSAIWSTDRKGADEFPMALLVPFFLNHGMLQLWPPIRWYSVVGGSDTYVKRIIERGDFDVRLATPVKKVIEAGDHVQVETANGTETFDYVVLASHADTSMKLAPELPERKRDLLRQYPYVPNRAVLHTDASVMPPDRRAWSSWNHVQQEGPDGAPVSTTVYWMNPLQQTASATDYFVSINPLTEIPADKVVKDISYAHPRFTAENFSLQGELRKINDDGRILFAGAYFRHGFHEDGLVSALDVVARLRSRAT